MATQMENALIPPAQGCDSAQYVYRDFVISVSCTPQPWHIKIPKDSQKFIAWVL